MILGIDPDTYKLTIVGIADEPVDNETPIGWTVPIRPKKDTGWEALLMALRKLEPALLASECPWKSASSIWIERAWGMSRKADYVLGCVVGALFATLPIICDAEVNYVSLFEWREAVTGESQATTDQIEAALMAHRHLRISPGRTKDQIDALGIAMTGRKLTLDASVAA